MKLVLKKPTAEEISRVCTAINLLGYMWIIEGNEPVEIEIIDLERQVVEPTPWGLRVISVIYDAEIKK